MRPSPPLLISRRASTIRLTRWYDRSVAITISWFERSSGMIFEMIISVVRSPIFGFAPRAAAAPRPPPFFAACCTWKISPSFCAISVAPVCLRLMIQTFSFAPG